LREADFDLELLGFDNSEIEDQLNQETVKTNDDVKINSCFEVIAECEHEEEQQMVYNILTEKEIKCRIYTL